MLGPDNSAQQPAALMCRGLDVRYGQIQVGFDIALDVEAGEIVTLLGPNGAGKSSLLGALAGLVPSTGEILLRSNDVSTLSPHRRARSGLAFVPEVRGNLFGALSVQENLQLGLRLVAPADRAATYDHLLDLFPILGERVDIGASMLSGGEQQMLAIAMAVARNPIALLLDEPTQGLAPAIFDVLENAFQRLKMNGLALLIAEQNIPFATRIADRFALLSEGTIVQRGERADLIRHDAILSGFIGSSNDNPENVTELRDCTDVAAVGRI